jgi:Fe-S-cluster containining protein
MYRDVCTHCKALCCTLVTPPLTKKERQKIIDAGFPNHFKKITEDVYVIKPGRSNVCPYLKDDYSCLIQDVKPRLCSLWPVIPYDKNNTRGCLIIHCPLFPLLSKETIETAMKEAANIPRSVIDLLWQLSPEMKEKYKKFEYERR